MDAVVVGKTGPRGNGTPRILVLKPSSLGDVVHTLPAVAELRAAWPESHISWLINPEWVPLLEGNSDVDRVVEFPRRQFRGLRGWLKIPGWLRKISGESPDLAMDFQGLLRTALIARFTGAKKIIGLADAREGAGFFYHQTVFLPEEPIHAVERYLVLARAAGAKAMENHVFRLPEGVKPERNLPQKFILLHPFSRGQGKSLGKASVRKLCEKLAPHQVVLVGSEKLEEPLPGNVIDLLGETSLAELIWLIRHAEFTVSVDSGPMHIAAAITKKLLSIHFWSDPLLVGPVDREAWIWKNGGICKLADYEPSAVNDLQPPDPKTIADFVASRLS